jgi:hypothetical protein
LDELPEGEEPRNESQPSQPRPSQSDERPEDDPNALVNDLDPFHVLRRQLTQLGFERGEYTGIPVPLEGIRTILEPTHPHAKAWDEINADTNPLPAGPHWTDHYDVANHFYSHKKRCDVFVLRHKRTGMAEFRLRPAVHSASQLIATLFASDVWGIEQEQRALQTLGGMVRHRQFKQYLLSGMFMESSPRSHVTYVFRRLRPTIALRAFRPEDAPSEEASILCALCMHPIAYYEGSWAGAMCPTDDVIAHLAMMRGDEHMFWKRCNQHQSYRPEAGL